jgi:hypothetical protein
MPKEKEDSIDVLLQGDWSKAYITLNQRSPAELNKLKKRYRWMNLLVPKNKLREFISGH